MTFLFALLLATLLPILFFIKRLRTAAALDERLDALDFVSALCMIMIQLGLMKAMFIRVWQQGDTNWTPLLIGAGGFGLGMIGAHHIWRTYRGFAGKTLTQNWTAAWLCVSVSGFYLGWTGVDHYLLWRDPSRMGIASDSIYKKADIDCDYPYVLLQRHGEEYVYRCPHNILLGHPIGQPFVPWPSYSTGISKQMTAMEKQLFEEAERQQHESMDDKR